MKAKIKKNRNKKLLDFSNINFANSYTSLFYGIITVVVLFILLFVGLKIMPRNQGQITNEAANTVTEIEQLNKDTYTVISGDNLWRISERFYNSGFKWVEIARANNLSNPNNLEQGTKLVIPQVERQNDNLVNNSSLTSGQQNSLNSGSTVKIEGEKYTIQKGDCLWDIALRAYGDGYKWVELAKVNNLSNPDIIHSGNTLTIPR